MSWNMRRLALPLSLMFKYIAKTGYATNQLLMPMHTRLYYWMRHTTQQQEQLKSYQPKNRIVNPGFSVHQRSLCGEIEQPAMFEESELQAKDYQLNITQPADAHPCVNGCQYAKDVGMPEHSCSGDCMVDQALEHGAIQTHPAAYVFTTTSDGGYVDGFGPGEVRHHELPAIQANNRRIQEARIK